MGKFGLKVKNKMAEFLLELFSEEIPSNLQASARLNLLTNFKSFFKDIIGNFKSDLEEQRKKLLNRI